MEMKNAKINIEEEVGSGSVDYVKMEMNVGSFG